MRGFWTNALPAALVLSAGASFAAAQSLELPAPSPLARVMQTVGIAEVSVEYSSPGVKGREIYGDLVPHDELWRTGANAATKLTLSRPARIGGEMVPAGTYALFTIPGAREWTLIVNENANQGGTGQYDAELDVLRMKVAPQKAPARERMTFLFSNTTDDSTELQLWWDESIVTMPIAFDTKMMATSQVDGYAKDVSGRLARAARYMAEQGEPMKAMALVDASIAADQTWYNTWTKAEMLAKQGKNAEARKLAQIAWDLGEKSESFFYRDQVKKALDGWPSF